MIREAIQKAVDGADLTTREAREAMLEIMSGQATDAQIAAFMTAMRMKGETVEEITEFARVMRELCLCIKPRFKGHLVDTCGTGGGRIKTFNISTIAAFITSAAGIAVAKHGNKSVSSSCGSSDLLERLGVNINLGPEEATKCLERVGMVFLFAPAFHPAMRNAIGPRREIGITTVFNLLGPLTNPANADCQVVGVYRSDLPPRLAVVLNNLGLKQAMVVHGQDGLDEISTLGGTSVAWLRDGSITNTVFTPADFGVKKAKPEEIAGADPQGSAEIALRVLNGERGPRLDIVLVNASACLLVGGAVATLSEGMELAGQIVESGAGRKKLHELVRESGGDLSRLEELEKKIA